MGIKKRIIIVFFLMIFSSLTKIVVAAHPNNEIVMANQLVNNYYHTLLLEDLSGFLNLLSDDVVHEINQGSTEIGKAKFKIFMEEQFSHGKINIKDLIVLTSEDGQYATSRYLCSGKYSKSANGYPPAKGQLWELPVVTFFKIKDNKISHVAVYFNEKDFVHQVS